MPTTTNAHRQGRKPIEAEVKFMNSLEEIFKTKKFSARVYPEEENSIAKANVRTQEDLEMEDICMLINIAKEWNMNFKIEPSGVGMRIRFWSI